jgi:hypothetical protein
VTTATSLAGTKPTCRDVRHWSVLRGVSGRHPDFCRLRLMAQNRRVAMSDNWSVLEVQADITSIFVDVAE